MYKTKLEELINTFSDEEMRNLGIFLRSPYFNQSKNMLKVYNFFGKGERKVLNKRKLFIHVYGNIIYSDMKIRLLISDFVKLIEEYILNEQLKKNQYDNDIILVNEFHKRNITKSYLVLRNKLFKYYESCQHKEFQDYRNLFLLTKNDITIKSSRELLMEKDTKDYYDVQKNINKQFIIMLLEFAIAVWQNKAHISSFNIDIWCMNEIIHYVENNIVEIAENDKSIYLYYLILCLYIKDERQFYISKILEHLKNNYPNMGSHMTIDAYKALDHSYNYSKSRNASDISNHMKTIILFYKYGFFDNLDYIRGDVFFNVISLFASSRKFKFAKIFYYKYRHKLYAQSKEEIECLSQSILLFYENKLGKMLGILGKLDFINFQFYLKAKSLQIMAFYDLQEFEALESSIDAFKHFLKRNKKILENRYSLYLRFCNIILKLFKFNENIRFYDPLLKEKILEERNIFQTWMLTKLNELEKQYASKKLGSA